MNVLKTTCPNCKKERTLHAIEKGMKCPDCNEEVIKFNVTVKN